MRTKALRLPSLCRQGLIVIMVLLYVLHPAGLNGQDKNENASISKPHSIKKAAIYSAVLPGLGQVYNKAAWKVPIIYAGFGVLTYFIISNNKEYQLYHEAYVYKANGRTDPIDNPYVDKYNLDQLQRGMDYYRRNRDLSFIVTGIWYTLNILEAYVDAHFFDYDISEDLSINIRPSASFVTSFRKPPAPGVQITLKF